MPVRHGVASLPQKRVPNRHILLRLLYSSRLGEEPGLEKRFGEDYNHLCHVGSAYEDDPNLSLQTGRPGAWNASRPLLDHGRSGGLFPRGMFAVF